MSFHFYLLAGAYVVAGELVDFLQLIHRGVVLGGQLREGLPFLYGDVRGCFGFLTLAFLVGLTVVVSPLSLAFALATVLVHRFLIAVSAVAFAVS